MKTAKHLKIQHLLSKTSLDNRPNCLTSVFDITRKLHTCIRHFKFEKNKPIVYINSSLHVLRGFFHIKMSMTVIFFRKKGCSKLKFPRINVLLFYFYALLSIYSSMFWHTIRCSVTPQVLFNNIYNIY